MKCQCPWEEVDSRDRWKYGLIGPVLPDERFPEGFARWIGTSFATPLVSGMAALILEHHGGPSPAGVSGEILGHVNPEVPRSEASSMYRVISRLCLVVDAHRQLGPTPHSPRCRSPGAFFCAHAGKPAGFAFIAISSPPRDESHQIASARKNLFHHSRGPRESGSAHYSRARRKGVGRCSIQYRPLRNWRSTMPG